jgi:arabinogalactan endo-1,4-beta-galactosidase
MNEAAEYYPKYYPAPYHGNPMVGDFKTVVICSVVSIGTAVGLFYFGRNLILNAQKDQVQKDSATDGSPATYATQFKMAFDNDNWFGWGTNNTLLFDTILTVPSKKVYAQTQAAYQKLYNRPLNTDLESELSSGEYNRFILILSRKPDN